MSAASGFPDDLTRALMREERAKEAAASAVAGMTRAQVVEAVRLVNLWPWLGDDALLVATGRARAPGAPPPGGPATAVNLQLGVRSSGRITTCRGFFNYSRNGMTTMADDLTTALLRARAAQQAAAAYAAGVTPAQANHIGTIASTYPGIGGTAVSLGLAGTDPTGPTARAAATAKAKQDAAKPPVGEQKSGGWLKSFARTVGHAAVGAAHGVEYAAKQVIGESSGVASATAPATTPALDRLRPGVRYGTVAAQAPLEYVQGNIRETYGGLAQGKGFDAASPLLQTTLGAGLAEEYDRGQLGQSLKDVFGPGKTDEEVFGNGWFVDPKHSAAGARQAAEAAASATIDGHAFTLGRLAASVTPFEPGSTGYNVVSGLVDFWSTLALDPLTYVGGKAAEANRLRTVLDKGNAVEHTLETARPHGASVQPTYVAGPSGTERVFVAQNAGVVDGVRPTVLPEKAAQWLNDNSRMGGNQVAARIAAISPGDPQAFNKIWRGTGKKLPVDLVLKLVDATDSATVKNHLADAIAEGEARNLIRLKTKKPPPRLAGMMPGDKIDTENPDDAVEQLDRWMRNARFDEPTISKSLEGLARAQTGGQAYDVLKQVMDLTQQSLINHGWDTASARRMTRVEADARKSTSTYNTHLISDGVTEHGIMIDGIGVRLMGPHLSTELLNRYIGLPNARDIKNGLREWGWLRELQKSGTYKVSRTALDFGTQSIFKPAALVLRPAWTVRVVREEQVRMAAAGYSSAFKHPLSYIALLIGDKPTVTAKGVDVATGKHITEDVPNLIWRALSKAKNAPNLGGTGLEGARFEDTDFVKGLSDFQRATPGGSGWNDQTVRAQTRHWDDIYKGEPEFPESWHHELVQFASAPETREIARHGAQAAKDTFWNGNLSKLRREMAASQHLQDVGIDLTRRDHSDAWIDAGMKRIQQKTGGHSDLVAAVATGRLRGKALTDGTALDKEAAGHLGDLMDFAPGVVKGTVKENRDGTSASEMLENYEHAVQWLFTHMISIPTNRLSRSKVFKQAYWQRLHEVVPLMNAPDKMRLLRNAKDAGIPARDIRAMRKTIDAQTVHGNLTLEKADVLAKSFALDTTRDLLYSLHEKSQVFDALRVVYPFGEAFREVVTRWAKLGLDPRTMNPLVPYRATQAVTNAQESGFFYPDPLTGREMFGLPGSEWLTNKLVGVPWKLEAPVSGLNMFGQVTPGVGPFVAMTASALLPDNPNLDFIRHQLLPFGETDVQGGFLESMLPSYIRRLLAVAGKQTPSQRRQMISTTRDVMAYLYSTGEYDISNQAGQKVLLDDAKRKAKQLWIIRALAQSSAPSSPTGVMSVKDKDGRLHALFAMAADFQKMRTQNFDTATERFLKKYGEYAFLVTIPKTHGDTAPTDVANMFARTHPDVAEAYPNTFGLFVPGGKVDPGEIQRQIDAGNRDVIDPKAAMRLANIAMAQAIYYNAKDQIGDSPAPNQTAYMRALKAKLVEKYPGYDEGDTGASPMHELERAAKDPVLSKTDAGQGLTSYLEFRKQAQASAVASGRLAGFTTAAAAQPIRDWLAQQAQQIIAEHPDFAGMWERVFAREVES
jgi:hypothetical protein